MKPNQITNLFVTLGFLFVATVTCTAQTKADKTIPVYFKHGTSSAVYADAIHGYSTIDYVLNAREGQQMSVNLKSRNSSLYFAIFVGAEQAELSADSASTDVTEWKGTLNKSGPYTVRVYLIRSAARRREAAGFSLTMKITGGGTNAALSEVFASETRINHAEYLFRIKAV